MVRETYDIWREVSEAREHEVRRKAAGDGHGPLFDCRASASLQSPPDGLPHPIPMRLLCAVAVVPRAFMAIECLKLRVGIAGDDVVSHTGDIIGRNQPWPYRVGPDGP